MYIFGNMLTARGLSGLWGEKEISFFISPYFLKNFLVSVAKVWSSRKWRSLGWGCWVVEDFIHERCVLAGTNLGTWRLAIGKRRRNRNATSTTQFNSFRYGLTGLSSVWGVGSGVSSADTATVRGLKTSMCLWMHCGTIHLFKRSSGGSCEFVWHSNLWPNLSSHNISIFVTESMQRVLEI